MINQQEITEEQKLKYPICQNIEQKIEMGRKYKEIGNEFYKNKDYKSALQSYYKVLLYVNGICDSNQFSQFINHQDAVDQNIKLNIFQLQIATYNNMSQIYLLQQKYSKTIENIDKVIKISKENSISIHNKTYFRRAQAYFFLKQFEKAQQDLKIITDSDQQNVDALKLLQKLQIQQKIEDKQSEEVYKKMFK